MRWILLGMAILNFPPVLQADEFPKVHEYLQSGRLARGEQVLQLALAESPKDDQVRFGLGVLKVFQGVERLGQALYHHGCRSENNHAQFLRLPVPKNPDPTPITYPALRRILAGFQNDLATAESILAGITDPEVKLRLKLATIHLDLDGDGQATDTLSDILTKLFSGRGNLRFPVDNPELEVCFDRGDVAWLRAYCHVLMAVLDIQLANDLEHFFDEIAESQFERPKLRTLTPEEREQRSIQKQRDRIVIREPARFERFREHVLAMCELNHQTWKFIRAEQDDDHEWLPNSKQKGVLGLPVTDVMIDAWLDMIDEFHALFDGTKVIPNWALQFVSSKVAPKSGFSFKRFLTDPPEFVDLKKVRDEGINMKYLEFEAKEVDIGKFFRVSQVFNNSFGVAYAFWFN